MEASCVRPHPRFEPTAAQSLGVSSLVRSSGGSSATLVSYRIGAIMKSIQAALILIASFILNAKPLFGCVCPVITLRQGIASADAIFSGAAKRLSDSEWLVEVERTWKGERIVKEVTVRDPAPMTSCSRRLDDGGRYIIFARVKTDRGQPVYYLDACNWLLKYPEAEKFIRKMGKGRIVHPLGREEKRN